METTLIDLCTSTGVYGLLRDEAIVEHPEHGRLWLRQEFGEDARFSGEAYRWEHATAIKIHDDDTIDSLKAGPWNDYMLLGDAVVAGYDGTRPVLGLSNRELEDLAAAAGLN